MYAFCGWRKRRFGKLASPLFWQLIHSPRIQDGGTVISTQLFTQCIHTAKKFLTSAL